MLKLFIVPGTRVVPSLSPPCAKLEGWLRLAGIPYVTALGAAELAPRGKLPYLEDDDGRVVSDATLALPWLRARFGVDPDAGLDASSLAVSTLARRTLKEHLYWAVVYTRWVPDDGFEAYRAVLAGALPEAYPWEARLAAVTAFRETALAQLRAQGLGRHSLAEVTELAAEDLAALATLLGQGPFFFGDTPRTLDVTAWATVTNLIDVPVDSPVREAAASHPGLVAHAARVRARLFGPVAP